jgi:hypothetical protein
MSSRFLEGVRMIAPVTVAASLFALSLASWRARRGWACSPSAAAAAAVTRLLT